MDFSSETNFTHAMPRRHDMSKNDILAMIEETLREMESNDGPDEPIDFNDLIVTEESAA